MSYQVGSSQLRAIFESAYRDYEIRTGIALAAQPFAQQLEYCHSAKFIITVLQGHVPAFIGSKRMMGSIESIVYDICMLSATIILSDASLQPILPGRAILTGLAILLTVGVLFYFLVAHSCDIQAHQSAKGICADYDKLIDCLGLIKRFLKHLEVYTKIFPTPPVDEILVVIIVELLAILAMMTVLMQGQSSAPALPYLLSCFMQRNRICKEVRRPGHRGNHREA